MTPDPIPGVPADREVAVLGLGRSGRAAALLLARGGYKVYASDADPAASEAAAELRAQGVDAVVGSHDLARISRAALAVVSPGIPPAAPPIAAARRSGVPVVSEIEIALRSLSRARFIAVTGTNGKSTTTSIAGSLLSALGVKAVAAGNIGRPLAEVALEMEKPDWIALELSSFQLHDTPGIRPVVGVLTNLEPDHLDRYGDADEYYRDKALLFSNATADSAWVANADDPAASGMAAAAEGRQLRFSTRGRADAWLDRTARELRIGGVKLLSRADLPLIGEHNVANALAAALAVASADEEFATAAARQAMGEALRALKPLPHRLEVVGNFDGVQWINDSKATNVSATRVALDGMARPTVVLLGGRHKGESYASLGGSLRKVAKSVIAFGEAAPIIERELSDFVPMKRLGSDFEEVIAAARERAGPGDAVLLSPACSSYDMFSDYEERGDRFRALASVGAGKNG